MTALLTRLANANTDLDIWLDRLSNWKFVAVIAGTLILVLVVEGCVFVLVDGHVALKPLVSGGVLQTVVFTTAMAWKRWK